MLSGISSVPSESLSSPQYVENLLQRIVTLKEKIEYYLQTTFVTIAQKILQEVKLIDSDNIFLLDPCKIISGYRSVILSPMHFSKIEKKLSRYSYSFASEFIEDMRLVINNCYQFNGKKSSFSAIAREIEINMEEQFTAKLNAPLPNVREIVERCRTSSREDQTKIYELLCFYEKTISINENHPSIIPEKLQIATQRRLLLLLRDIDEKNTQEKQAVIEQQLDLFLKRVNATATVDAPPRVFSCVKENSQNNFYPQPHLSPMSQQTPRQPMCTNESSHLAPVHQNNQSFAFVADLSPVPLSEGSSISWHSEDSNNSRF